VSKHRRFYFDVNIFDIEVIALYTFAMAKDIVDEMLDQWARERPELDASPLSVAVRVQMLGRRFRRDAERSLAKAHIDYWDYEVLATLRRHGHEKRLTATRLAELSQISRAAMTHRIDRLESRGLVTRQGHESDRRAVLVSLTVAGRSIVDKALEPRLRAARDSISGLTKTERRTIARLMRKLMLTENDA
jgi:DNA-binding MarR family transcriptional regulator